MLGKLFFPSRFVYKLDLQSINKYKTTPSEEKSSVLFYCSVVKEVNKVTWIESCLSIFFKKTLPCEPEPISHSVSEESSYCITVPFCI